MIYGIGCDLIEIARIENSCKNGRFAARCFSAKELAAFSESSRRLAGCFAAKEAFSKALGTGVRGFSLSEISVLRDSLGKPYFEFEGRAGEIVKSAELSAFVSISNTDFLAMAAVVLERRSV